MKLTNEALKIRKTLNEEEIINLDLFEIKELVDFQIITKIPKIYWSKKENCIKAIKEIMDDLYLSKEKLVNLLDKDLLEEYGFDSMINYFGGINVILQEIFNKSDKELALMNIPPVSEKFFNRSSNIKLVFNKILKDLGYKKDDVNNKVRLFYIRKAVSESVLRKNISSIPFNKVVEIATGINIENKPEIVMENKDDLFHNELLNLTNTIKETKPSKTDVMMAVDELSMLLKVLNIKSPSLFNSFINVLKLTFMDIAVKYLKGDVSYAIFIAKSIVICENFIDNDKAIDDMKELRILDRKFVCDFAREYYNKDIRENTHANITNCINDYVEIMDKFEEIKEKVEKKKREEESKYLFDYNVEKLNKLTSKKISDLSDNEKEILISINKIMRNSSF